MRKDKKKTSNSAQTASGRRFTRSSTSGGFSSRTWGRAQSRETLLAASFSKKNTKREALDMIFLEFKRAVRQFDAAERVYVSVLCLSMACTRR